MLPRLEKKWKQKLKDRGYEEDREGNFEMIDINRCFIWRWKLGKRTVRLETRGIYGNDWDLVRSYLYPKV